MSIKNIGRIKRQNAFDYVNIILLTVMALLTLYPFYNVLIVSFAKYETIVSSPTYLFPKSFDIKPYTTILKDSIFYRGFFVTAFITVVGTLLSMTLSVCGAYALSKKTLPGRNFILACIVFTMFFGGGLIPYYLVIKSVGLIDKIWVMIIPPAVNTWYLIIMKNYFATLSPSMEESAKMDGANDLYILGKIIVPISAPFMATFALFYSVERWSEWWNALIFINNYKLRPLQIVLREILINYNSSMSEQAKQMLNATKKVVYMPSYQMAAIVVSVIPILLVYPYLQKYFVQGIMIGSIKE